jgi:outer membrane receptor protein involved in Fe transport
VQPGRGVRIDPSIRAEFFLVSTEDVDLAWAPVLAPKVTATLFENRATHLFLSYGRGFRSPDARAAGDGGRAPVSTSDSFESSIALQPEDRVDLRLTGFATFVSNEIVFDHAAARYLASGSTRRLGAEAGATFRPVESVRLEADATWTEGRYTGSGEPIPYAPRMLVVLGAYTEHLSAGRARITAGLRGWGLGPRPLPGGFSSHAAAVLDLTARADLERWGFSIDVDNVLGTRWRDGEFLFPSRWDPSDPRAELPVRHFTAGAAPAARFALERRL